MNERIKAHIDMLFVKAPHTRKALELKEELLANSEERYQDLIADGVAAEDAIRNVIGSIGNVSELFQGLEEITSDDKLEFEAYIKKSALIKTVSVGLYIFGLVVFLFSIFADHLLNNQVYFTGMPVNYYHINYIMLGLIAMILIDIIPTCMLVYITSLAPKYRKQEDTVVENFKEWNSKAGHQKSIRDAASVVLWTATVFLYFTLSFATYAWNATWIIFLVAACLQAVIVLYFRLKESA